MRKLARVFSIAMMMVCCVMMLPAAVSAEESAVGDPYYDATNNILYACGHDIHIAAETAGELKVMWGDDDNFYIMQPEPTIYMGYQTVTEESDLAGGSLTLSGVTVKNLYAGNADGSGKNLDGVTVYLWEGSTIETAYFGGVDSAYIVVEGTDSKIGTWKNANVNVIERIELRQGATAATACVPDELADIAKILIDLNFDACGGEVGGADATGGCIYAGESLTNTVFDFGLEAIKNPTRKGYKFAGWYIDEKYTEKFELDTVITEDSPGVYLDEYNGYSLTLYAKWEPASTVGPAPEPEPEPEPVPDPEEKGPKMGGENGMTALLLMTAAMAGIAGGALMMRRKAAAKK